MSRYYLIDLVTENFRKALDSGHHSESSEALEWAIFINRWLNQSTVLRILNYINTLEKKIDTLEEQIKELEKNGRSRCPPNDTEN